MPQLFKLVPFHFTGEGKKGIGFCHTVYVYFV